MRDLPVLLDRLQEADGAAEPVPSADGWELVLAENVAYSAGYRQSQAVASAQLPAEVPAVQRAYQLLRRHGQVICRRKDPACSSCAIAADCPSAGHPLPLY